MSGKFLNVSSIYDVKKQKVKIKKIKKVKKIRKNCNRTKKKFFN